MIKIAACRRSAPPRFHREHRGERGRGPVLATRHRDPLPPTAAGGPLSSIGGRRGRHRPVWGAMTWKGGGRCSGAGTLVGRGSSLRRHVPCGRLACLTEHSSRAHRQATRQDRRLFPSRPALKRVEAAHLAGTPLGLYERARRHVGAAAARVLARRLRLVIQSTLVESVMVAIVIVVRIRRTYPNCLRIASLQRGKVHQSFLECVLICWNCVLTYNLYLFAIGRTKS